MINKPPISDREKHLEALLDKHGICDKCGELYTHSYDEPFASCGCCQSEWYDLTPHMKATKAVYQLRTCIGFVENGTDRTVSLCQDDATKIYYAGSNDGVSGVGESLADAINDLFSKVDN